MRIVAVVILSALLSGCGPEVEPEPCPLACGDGYVCEFQARLVPGGMVATIPVCVVVP